MTNDNRKVGIHHRTFRDDQEYRLSKSSSRLRMVSRTLFALLTALAAAIIAFCVWAYFFDW